MTRTFDPFDAEQVQAAWPLLEELRRQAPLAPLADGMQYVTRHAECRRVLRDTASFSNASGFKAPGVVVLPEDKILGEMDPPQHTAVRRVMAFPDFAGYIDDRIAERAAELEAGNDQHPGEVLTRLLKVTVGEGHLSRRQVRALVRNLITGGLTTTSQLLGNLIHEILTDPHLHRAVWSEGSSLDLAIEESLRLRPPVMFVLRGCIEDTTVDGLPVRAGERLVVGTASASRDERVFVDPDECHLDRNNAHEHLTFGHGPHVCPGANLARTVARIGMEALLERFPQGRLRAAADHRYENVPTFFECGPRHLLVETS